MKVISDREEMVFRHDRNDKTVYTVGLVKKNMDGEYERGYILTKFRNGVELDNRTLIKLKDAWLDFYKVDNKTNIALFVNDFELAEQGAKTEENAPNREQGANMQNDIPVDMFSSKNGITQPVPYTDEDLPF